jgi:mitotic spindle assembly checkpoint protein MAD2B
MAALPNPTTVTSPPLNTYASLAVAFTSFLRVATHQILFLRSIYPRVTFLPVRAYNYPIRQSRHPKVCEYINDVAVAVEKEILKGTVTAVTLIIFSIQTNRPMERYVFDLSGFPRVSAEEIHTEFEKRGVGEQQQTSSKSGSAAAATDLDAQFRACLARFASSCMRLSPLSKDDEFGFTVCIEVRDDALPPAGTTRDEQAWIVAEPELVNNRLGSAVAATTQSSLSSSLGDGQQKRGFGGKAKTVPIRRVEAGELRLELWVEESRQKFAR